MTFYLIDLLTKKEGNLDTNQCTLTNILCGGSSQMKLMNTKFDYILIGSTVCVIPA